MLGVNDAEDTIFGNNDGKKKNVLLHYLERIAYV